MFGKLCHRIVRICNPRGKNKTNSNPAQRIADNSYDPFGQLIKKKVGGNALSELQVVDYKYNIRGWLKAINDINNLGTVDLFAFKLGYNEGTTPLYNGNISLTQWKTRNTDSSLKTYNYTYDALNRIKTATNTNTNANYNLDLVNYDKNEGGALRKCPVGIFSERAGLPRGLALKRKGHTNAAATTFGMMDDLAYTYDAGNKLTKVEDIASLEGFKNGANTTTEYTYDPNGNMLSDANKGITNITYNHLNLPTQVFINNPEHVGNISYIYDASGVKLKKITSEGGSLITTEYASNYVYEGGVLQFFNHAEGYVEPKGLGWEYVFQYKDHLGNIRLSYADADGNGLITQTEIREENNYYPFGLKHKGYNNAIGGSRDHKYGFGNKEEQDELSLAWLDFGARNYDAVLGRWFGIDKKAELYFGRSPYIYALNTPIQAIDPDGNLVIFINGNHFGSGSDNRGRGTPDYWRTGKNTGFDIDVMNHLNDQNAIYRDGSLGGFAPFNTYSLDPGLRKDIGFKQGKKDAELIIVSLQKDSDGNIVESIKIISHSMGGAYAKGYVEAILEYARQNGIKGLIIAFEADFAPFQTEDQKAVKAKNMGPTIQFSNEDDFIAGNKPIDGAEQEDTSDDDGLGHSILDFIDQIKKLPTGNYKVENGKILPVKEK